MYSRSNFWATIDKCVYGSCSVESPSMLSRCSLLSFVLPTNVTRLHHINYISATRDANPNVPERHDDPRSNYLSFLFHSFFFFALLRNLHSSLSKNSLYCWNHSCANHFQISVDAFKTILWNDFRFLILDPVRNISLSISFSIFWVVSECIRGSMRVFFTNRVILRFSASNKSK